MIVARAAISIGSCSTTRGRVVRTSSLFTSQLALGLRTGFRLGAFPVAVGFFTDRAALRLRGSASGVANSGRANSFTLGARVLFTHILGAADGASGLLAVNGALGTRGFLAFHLATRALADRVANSGANRIITLPSAKRVARSG